MDYTKLFYWLTVADNAKTFFGTFAIFFTVVFLITQIARFVTSMSEDVDYENDGFKLFLNKCNKWTWYSTPFMLFFLSLWIFTPNKKDALLIIAGGQTVNFLASDEAAKQIPKELTNFVVTELKQMAKEAEVDLNIQTEKEKILDKARDMTADELLKLMKSDSSVTKILLDK